jgi:putative ABC transport system substrate-binding protein
MKRREFIIGAAAVASGAATRCDVRAQETPNRPLIGFLGANTAAAQRRWVAAFTQRLSELGWVEGHNLAIDFRWAEGRNDRAPEILADFVHRKVDVIVTHATPNVVAAHKATKDIPIVFAAMTDPVALGVVATLARPGGNATGLSIQSADVAGKRLELLRDVRPDLRQLAILVDAGISNEIEETAAAARVLGLTLRTVPIHTADDIAPAFLELRGTTDAVYLQTTPLLASYRARIGDAALAARLPTISGIRTFADSGALMSYGPDFVSLFRRTAEIVAKVLRGTKPADIPVEQPTKFDFVVNLKTAKALGLSVPLSLLALADEVIE